MTAILDLFWRVVLYLFGWIPERLLPWFRTRIAKVRHDHRLAVCRRQGHRALVRVTIPVALYYPKRTAIIQRRLYCDYCNTTTYQTWKGRMTDQRRARLARILGTDGDVLMKEPS